MANFNELRLRARAEETRGQAVRDIAPIEQLRMRAGRPAGAHASGHDDSSWDVATPGTVWGGEEAWAWFRITFRVPEPWAGQEVRLRLLLGGQAMAYLDGEPWQGLDDNHRTTTLPALLHDGRPHLLAVECYAAAATTGPRRPQEQFALGDCQLELIDSDVDGYGYDLLAGTDALRVLPEGAAERAPLFGLLLEAENLVDRRDPRSEAFVASVRAARAHLAEGLPRLAAGSAPGRPRILAVGHAHIDTAWLWPLAQTRRKVARSWSTVLRLMERYPDYHFLCSQPQHYLWMEEDEPAIFAQLSERIKEGRWEPAGALWVEPDGNLPSGESWVRQLLFGQRYFERQFGRRSRIVWLPDSFGYSGALPQLLRGAGVHTIVTSKLSWNATNRMPHDTFRWRGIDGTEVMSYFITAGVDPRAEGWASDPDAPQIGMATYNGHMTAPELMGAWTRFRDKGLSAEVLYPYGWGDGGGGPTEEMLEFATRMGDYPGMPKLRQASAEDFLQGLHDHVWGDPRAAVWEGELYLEYHRGTYTSQAGVKRGNRRAEHALHEAELWASWAGLVGAAIDGWRPDLYRSWEIVLRNQFHDILPGSSVAEVYVDQRAEHAEALRLAEVVTEAAQEAIIGSLPAITAGPSLVVFDALPWGREDVATFLGQLPADRLPVDGSGQGLPTQEVRDWDERVGTLIDKLPLDALSVTIVPLVAEAGHDHTYPAVHASERVLESDSFRLELDETGSFASLLDKRHGRQVLAPGGGGNRLLAFEDKPISYDAWDIDSYYVEKATPLEMVDEWRVIEDGPVRAGVEIVRHWEGSTIRQRILLYANVPRIEVQTDIEWHHRQVLLKVAFPLAVHATEARYECAFGHVARPTHRNTSWDEAKFEVSGHRWADLSETGYGVSLLNDGKYGHDCLGNVLRLTLLKSANSPDPLADEGHHRFSYALMPHGPDWGIEATVRAAYAFNMPARLRLVQGKHALAGDEGGGLRGQSLVRSDSDHAVVDTVKPAEDGDGLIVRVYDCANRRGPVGLAFLRPIAAATAVTLLEEQDHEAGAIALDGGRLTFDLLPFQVRSFRVRLGG